MSGFECVHGEMGAGGIGEGLVRSGGGGKNIVPDGLLNLIVARSAFKDLIQIGCGSCPNSVRLEDR